MRAAFSLSRTDGADFPVTSSSASNARHEIRNAAMLIMEQLAFGSEPSRKAIERVCKFALYRVGRTQFCAQCAAGMHTACNDCGGQDWCSCHGKRLRKAGES